MRAEIDLAGRLVLVVGRADRARRAVARYRAAGASVEVTDADTALARLAGAVGDQAVPGVIAWVEGDEQARDRLRHSARIARAVMLSDDPVAPTPRGHVSLIGSGPGDPELMTIAGLRALAEADVVLHDRLGPSHVVAEYAPGALLIDVGKTPGHHAVPQREIERIMLEHAARGLRVVRVKGGDPFVFGRGGEEVVACRAAGVPVTVIPGVSSAVAVPSAAGIPVTHREVSRAFTVVSGHAPFSEEELGHLVGLGGTLVVLMGVGTLPHLAAGLQRHGMAADMPLAILERGFSAAQRAVATTVGEVVSLLPTVKPVSPAVIVIGEVVGVTGPVGWGIGEILCQDEALAAPEARAADLAI
ncbi:uroporphyrinogen-III C-methyltransferase [Microbacterium sp. MTN4-26]|uniref:uroporphyrinogen-III C-methyltransferase n=1 Tax=unclassified Microbacterium TaxID=2609290 RepID=UPI0036F19DEA